MHTLRQRRSLSYAGPGPSVLSDVGWTPLGQPSGVASMHPSSAAASALATTLSAAPAAKVALVKPSPRAAVGQPSTHQLSAKIVCRVPQAAQKSGPETGPAQKQSAAQQARGSAGPASKSGARTQTLSPTSKSKPVPSPPKQPQMHQAANEEPHKAHRQGHIMAQLVDKYKTESAARKQIHVEETLERVNSLGTTLQRGGSHTTPGGTMAPKPVHKQAAAAVPAGAASDRKQSAAKVKAAPKLG